ncbi:MAG: NAD(P)-dependent alcohol dehydrogenase [Myxococcota bacterium]
MSTTNRAWEIGEQFGLDHLRKVDREPFGDPGPGQIRLRVEACSLNFRDLLMVEGNYDPRLKLPMVPLSDGAGIVEAVGEGVTRVAVGDRVCGCFAPVWFAGEPDRTALRTTRGGPLPGFLQETMLLDAEGVVKAPAHLSAEEAATLPCAALTAWSALVELGGLRAGDVVLVQGTGGVSIAALQLANLFGAKVIVTSSSDAKLEKATALGAWKTINYRSDESWGKTAGGYARELTGRGVDHIVEVGGAGTLDQSLRAVRAGGHIAMIGILAGVKSSVALTKILMSQIRVQGVLVGHRAGFEAMNRAIVAHGMKPVVDKVFAFDETVEAFEYLKSGKHFGKNVIRVGAS